MSAYIIAHIDVRKPVQYEQYRTFSTLAMRAHDVKVLVRGGESQVLEGEDMKRTVILQFPSMKAAQSFYDSMQYRRARNVREGVADVQMSIVQGL